MWYYENDRSRFIIYKSGDILCQEHINAQKVTVKN
jgi:hypothetical protein